MTPGQVEALILMASDESVSQTLGSQPSTSTNLAIDAASATELSVLKAKVAELSERIDVLERLYKK
jgi:hypothetical protein